MEFKNAVEIMKKSAKMLLTAFGQQIQLSEDNNPEDNDRSAQSTTYDFRSLEIICQGLQQYYPLDGLMGEGLKELAPKLNMKLNNQEILPGKSKKMWVIDPICGTVPFSRGIPDFIISVACVSVDDPLKILVGIVIDPVHNEIFYAEAGRGSFLNGQPIKVSNIKSTKELKNRGIISIEHKMIRETEYNNWAIKLSQKVARFRTAGTCGLEFCYVASGRLDAVLKARQPLYDYAAGLLILREAGGIATNFDGSELIMRLNYQKITDIIASNGKIHQIIIDERS